VWNQELSCEWRRLLAICRLPTTLLDKITFIVVGDSTCRRGLATFGVRLVLLGVFPEIFLDVRPPLEYLK
jgi:hypothetical protein